MHIKSIKYKNIITFKYYNELFVTIISIVLF